MRDGSHRTADRLLLRRRACYAVLVCLLFALSFTACGTLVYSKQPVGDQPIKLESSLWEGIWTPRHEGSGQGGFFSRAIIRQIYVKVADADKGVLRLSWVEERDGDFKLVGVDAHVRRLAHWLLVSVPWPNGEAYWWARVEIFPPEKWPVRGGVLVVWPPDGSELLDPIRKGTVSGRIFVTKDERLIEIEPDGIAWMQSHDDSTGAFWLIPTVYERIHVGSLDPPPERKPEQSPGQTAGLER